MMPKKLLLPGVAGSHRPLRRPSRATLPHRRGVVLIMALVCLVLVTVLGGTLLRWAAMEHKFLRAKEDESQARWLAEASLERAAARLTDDADYRGETWDIAASELPLPQPARVRLVVKSLDGPDRRRSIEVDVEYPFESVTPARVHKEVVFALPSRATP
ncbi:MAG TPA: hypothetical protein VHC22_09235 [Pirellulales bacterium]|nr:hypothetical protein [Pirellulales bacterium]